MANENRLIDANALKREFSTIADRSNLDYIFIDVISDAIEDAPTEDVEPVVHGRWVAKETMIRSPFAENYYCSECKTEGSPQWKRCPVCEAKMDGERKENEETNEERNAVS